MKKQDFIPKYRNFFVTIHKKSLENIGLTTEEYMNPEFLADFLIERWEESGKGRKMAVSVCESAQGLYHVHAACYSNSTTIKAVSEVFGNAHVHFVRGTKEELKRYILKEGKHAEKGENILFSKGIENILLHQGKRTDLEEVAEIIQAGGTAKDIYYNNDGSLNLNRMKYDTTIQKAIRQVRMKNMGITKDLTAFYHVGKEGTGKSYTQVKLAEEQGIENIYICNTKNSMDNYILEGMPKTLILDDFKGDEMRYQELLTMLDVYTKNQTSCRYVNTYNLWTEVHLTSIYPPEEIYKKMVKEENRETDSYKQLLRRITYIVYHYIENDEFKTFTIPAKEYKDYEDLKKKALEK